MMLGVLMFASVLAVQAEGGNPAAIAGWITAEDGLKLYYRKQGNGPQAIVIPLGFIMERDFKRLAHPGRTLVFYDQRNRGRSEVASPERSTLEDEVRDMETLRRQLHLDRITIIGFSYLGLMTVMYAMEFPDHVERLVQLGPVPRAFGTRYAVDQTHDEEPAEISRAELEEVRRLRREGMSERDPKGFCERAWKVERHWLVGDPAKVDALGPGYCDMPNEWPVNLAKQWTHRMPLMQKLDLPLDRIRGVTQPVLTIHGTKDRNAPYGAGREWASLLPNARLFTVPGAAHQSFAEAPGLVFEAIEEFLEGRWPKLAQRIAR